MSEQDDTVPIPAGPGFFSMVQRPVCASKALSEIRELLNEYATRRAKGRGALLDPSIARAHQIACGFTDKVEPGCDAFDRVAWWISHEGRNEAMREPDPLEFIACAIGAMGRGERELPTVIPSVYDTIVGIVKEAGEIEVVRLLELVHERRPNTLQGEARGEVLAMLEDGTLWRTSAWSVRLFRCP